MEWVLGVQIDGEWEHCRFSDRNQALKTFAAISLDYPREIQGAVLMKATVPPRLSQPVSLLIH